MTDVAVLAHDAIHENVPKLPAGQAAGYTTGSVEIQWTNTDFAAHPNAVRICQDAGATDETADVLDVETGAATLADCPVWAAKAKANYTAVNRPGQRSPAIYTSADNVSPVVDALISGGVSSGVGLFVANWGISQADAEAMVLSAAGPFPIIGVQFQNEADYDDDVFSQNWLETTSHLRPKLASGWVTLKGAPAGVNVWFSLANETLGYHKSDGTWVALPLP